MRQRLSVINPNFAQNDEFTVISSAVIGGASLFGGKGKVIPGSDHWYRYGTGHQQRTYHYWSFCIYPEYFQRTDYFQVAAVMVDSIKNNGDIH